MSEPVEQRRDRVFPMVVNIVLGCLVVAVGVIRVAEPSAAWTIAGYAVLAAAALAVVLLARRRARAAGRRRPDREQRRLMRCALRDMGRLPESADESWRPALRQAVVGLPFLPTFVSWIFLLAALIIVPAVPEVVDESLVERVRDIAILAALVVVGALISAGFVGFMSRAQGFNAQKMLDQLDARRDA